MYHRDFRNTTPSDLNMLSAKARNGYSGALTVRPEGLMRDKPKPCRMLIVQSELQAKPTIRSGSCFQTRDTFLYSRVTRDHVYCATSFQLQFITIVITENK
jgi:hypothetical protein